MLMRVIVPIPGTHPDDVRSREFAPVMQVTPVQRRASRTLTFTHILVPSGNISESYLPNCLLLKIGKVKMKT